MNCVSHAQVVGFHVFAIAFLLDLGTLLVCSCVCPTLMKTGTNENDSVLEQGGPELDPIYHFNKLQHENI